MAMKAPKPKTAREKDIETNEKLKKAGIKKIMKTVKRYHPTLFSSFISAQAYDSRKKSKVTYPAEFLLCLLLFKYILSYISMNSFQVNCNESTVIANLLYMTGMKGYIDHLPYAKTINDFLCKLDPSFLEGVMWTIAYRILRMKIFYRHRLNGRYWIIAIDGTQLYSGLRKINDKCLFRIHNQGKKNEYTEYYISVLIARIVFPELTLGIPIGVEFIQNNAEDAERQKSMGAEKIKQDCEIKACQRMVKKLKKRFPKLPVCIVVDSLYVSKPFLQLCADVKWPTIIRYKSGAYPEIQEIVEMARKTNGITLVEGIRNVKDAGFYSDIELSNGTTVNYFEAQCLVLDPKPHKGRGKQSKNTEQKWTSFCWITTLPLTEKIVADIISAGRSRWDIEESFFRNKKLTNDITHMCSWNEKAIKNHLFMFLIADLFRQLYEYDNLIKPDMKWTLAQVIRWLRYGMMNDNIQNDPEMLLFSWKKRQKKKPGQTCAA